MSKFMSLNLGSNKGSRYWNISFCEFSPVRGFSFCFFSPLAKFIKKKKKKNLLQICSSC